VKHKTKRNCHFHLWTKKKQKQNLINVKLNSTAKRCSIPDEVLSDNIVVFDGGEVGNPPLIPPDGIKWICYQMSAGDLWIEDTTNPNLGLSYGSLNYAPTFIRLPHSESLTIMKESQDLCNAIRCCIKAQ